MKIKGLSMHQDFAGCGTALPDAVNEYRVTELIKMGGNGWRTAHNPVNKEILDYTDRHGLLVWNENRNLERQVIGVQTQERLGSSVRRRAFHDIDGLHVAEKWKGVDPMYLNDAQALVLGDRNHPSVIIWSSSGHHLVIIWSSLVTLQRRWLHARRSGRRLRRRSVQESGLRW